MAVKHMPMSSLIIGIDLDPIRAIKGCITLVGDITTQKSRQVACLQAPVSCWVSESMHVVQDPAM